MDKSSSASQERSRLVKIGALFIFLLGAAVVYYQNGGQENEESLDGGQGVLQAPATAVTSSAPFPSAEMKTKAPPVQPAVDRNSSSDEVETPHIDVATTMFLLEDIKRDDDGKLVVDTDSLRLLNRAVRALNGQADDSSMALLGEFIEAELPGAEGEKARQIFSTYVEYKSAEDELVSQATDAEVETAAATLEQLSALRRSYFGDDIAAQLFHEEEQFLRKTIAAMAEAEKEASAE